MWQANTGERFPGQDLQTPARPALETRLALMWCCGGGGSTAGHDSVPGFLSETQKLSGSNRDGRGHRRTYNHVWSLSRGCRRANPNNGFGSVHRQKCSLIRDFFVENTVSMLKGDRWLCLYILFKNVFFFLRLQQNFHLVLPESNICLVLFENEFTFHLLMPHLLIRKHCWPLAWTVNQCLFMAFPGTVSRVSLCAVSTNFQFPASAKSLFFNLWMLSFPRSNTIKISCHFLPCGHFSINFLYFFHFATQTSTLFSAADGLLLYFLKGKKKIICFGD